MTGDADLDAAERPARSSERPPPISTRAQPPRPRRLSQRTIALFAGGTAIGLALSVGLALGSSHRHAAPQETVKVGHRPTSDVLAAAPKDYGAVAEKGAELGPPPISSAAAGAGALPLTDVPPEAAAAPSGASGDGAAERQRLRQQQDSARSSKLFAASNDVPHAAQTAETPPSLAAGTPTSPESAPAAAADAQDRKAAFVAGGGAAPTINSGRLQGAPGRFTLVAGSTIAAALVTGLSSDLPGEVVAQVTEDVFDSATGHALLIPQGARLLGSYDAHVSYGQSRALVVWTRLILPDGRSLALDRMIGTDAGGRAGFSDRVDRHTGKLLQAGLLSTLFGVGSGVASGGGGNSDIAFAIRDSAGQSVERAGDKLVEHQLDVQPTITIRAGARVRVLVSRDLVLKPWPEGAR